MNLRQKAAADEETLRRLRRQMAAYKRQGHTAVAIDHVLDLMDSNGAWRHEVGLPPDRPAGNDERGPVITDPRADPILGTMPVDPAAYR